MNATSLMFTLYRDANSSRNSFRKISSGVKEKQQLKAMNVPMRQQPINHKVRLRVVAIKWSLLGLKINRDMILN